MVSVHLNGNLILCFILAILLLSDLCFVFYFETSQDEAIGIKAAGKAWYQTMISDSQYAEFENFSKWLGVSQ